MNARLNISSIVMGLIASLFAMVCFVLLASCGGNDRVRSSADAGAVADTVAAKHTDTKRQSLILELKRLKQVFISGDKNQVADLFTFPAPDTVLSVYLDDTTFGARLHNNNDELSRDIFLDFYPKLSRAMLVQEMDTLFRVLSLDSLADRDTLERYLPVKGEPCVKYYRITIEGESVVIVTGIDSSKDYIDPETKQKEILSEECESAVVWVFRFDGKKLALKQHTQVG